MILRTNGKQNASKPVFFYLAVGYQQKQERELKAKPKGNIDNILNAGKFWNSMAL